MKIGILTCDKCQALSPRDRHLLPLFEAGNGAADVLVWDDPHVDWKTYDGLIFRSVWDYHLKAAEFNLWMDFIEQQGVKTLNPIPVIRQNQHKFYLRELQQKGVAIVPTLFIERTERLDLSTVDGSNWQQAVIKPAVSASSYLTSKFAGNRWKEIESEYTAIARERDLLVQPFMPEVVAQGELSLVFFNRQYSHAVLKRATAGDFRVQAEFGGKHEVYFPSTEVIETVQQILSLVEGSLLYARVDGVMVNNRFVLMELEMLEPDLYFDAHPDASARYVDAAMQMLAGKTGSLNVI